MANRIAIGNLIESIDFMDPTRSHEALPSRRMNAAPVWPSVAAWLAVLTVLFVVLALAVR